MGKLTFRGHDSRFELTLISEIAEISIEDAENVRKTFVLESSATFARAGAEAVSIFRAFMMNKPQEQGAPLGWHQDVGEGWGIDTLPTMTVWMALDKASIASGNKNLPVGVMSMSFQTFSERLLVRTGAMQLVRGSHSRGVLNHGHFADEETLAQFPPEDTIDLVCEAGEVILLHNLTLHRSGVNTTTDPRRAISVAFIDARCVD